MGYAEWAMCWNAVLTTLLPVLADRITVDHFHGISTSMTNQIRNIMTQHTQDGLNMKPPTMLSKNNPLLPTLFTKKRKSFLAPTRTQHPLQEKSCSWPTTLNSAT